MYIDEEKKQYEEEHDQDRQGPLRVEPGGLAVSRAFGNVEVKIKEFGGKPGMISTVPDVEKIEIDPTLDFIFLGCDGIYDKLTNEQIIEEIWNQTKLEENKSLSKHEVSAKAVEAVLNKSMEVGSTDNVTALIVNFKSLKPVKKNSSNTTYVETSDHQPAKSFLYQVNEELEQEED